MPATPRLTRFLLPLLLLLAGLPATTPVALGQSGAPALSGVPGAIEATVALGTSAQVALTLRNASDSTLIPRLFEANPALAGALARPSAATRATLPRQGARIDPQLSAELAASATGEAEFLVFLADQAELAPAYAIEDWSARGAYVYRTLRDHAEAEQRGLRTLLDARGLRYRPLWIVNALAVHGDAADLAALAARAEVAELRANRTAALDAPPVTAPAQTVSPTCSPDAGNRCWNIARVGAGRVWDEFGVRGQGIVVANIDSGVRFDHPALLGQYRGNSGGTLSHSYSWFDVYGGLPAPVDSGNHGTHTMGTMVGLGRSAAEPAVGVAPGARWIAVRACGASECSEINLILAAEWLLAPTDLSGANPRPDLRPQVVNNSWTAGQNASWYAGYTAAWRAAGIYPVFAAGNSGNLSGCGTVQSPGDYADVTAAGALDSSDRLASFSSIGPGPGGRVKPDLTAPGSGIWSTIADPSRPYASNSGTSMAAPHVAGAVALLWAANPSLIGDYDATYAALTGGAAPITGDSRYLGATHSACAPSGVPNNIYGYGRLDTYGAVARVSVDLPWLSLPEQSVIVLAPGAERSVSITLDARRVPGPGSYQGRILVHGPDLSRPPLVVPVTLVVPPDASYATVTGRVTRAADGAPIAATVQVTGGALVATDAQGRYSLTLPPATAPYTLIADARDHVGRPATVQLDPGTQALLDFVLDDDAAILVADTAPRSAALAFGEQITLPVTLRNDGSKPLSYNVSLPPERFGVWRSDEPDGPSDGWSAPPADAVSIPLADDGASGPIALGFSFAFAGASYEQIYVSANGVISFSPLPPVSVPFARSCLPLSETPGAAIAALRVDLDPSAAGARVSYARVAGGLLVTWEAVPLYNDPATRLSFQALLLPDGRISLRYREPGDLPPAEAASYGLQFSSGEVQTIGCRANLQLSAGLTLELRPQLPTSSWLQADRASGSVAPGGAVELLLTVRWARPTRPGWALSGGVLLQTNDLARQEVRLPVRLSSSAAPHTLYFPRMPNAKP